MWIITAITGIVKGLGGIGAITKSITDLQMKKLEVQNNLQRLQIEAEIDALAIKRDAMIAASVNDRWYSQRNLMGYAVTIFVWKIVVYDTVLGWGFTPNPGQLVTWVVITVIGFFFVSKSADKITDGLVTFLLRKAKVEN